MNKIQKAQELADRLLDECICQVGDDKGALPDEPEDVEDSMNDLEDYVEMEESAPVTGQALAKLRLGVERNDKNYKEGNDMDPEAKANAKKRVEESDQVAIAQQKDTLFDKLEKVVKDSNELDPSLNPEPTSEADDSIAGKIATWMRKKAGMNTNKDKQKLAKSGDEADQSNVNFYRKSKR